MLFQSRTHRCRDLLDYPWACAFGCRCGRASGSFSVLAATSIEVATAVFFETTATERGESQPGALQARLIAARVRAASARLCLQARQISFETFTSRGS